MTDDQNWGREEPWQPTPYDPHAHQQRLSDPWYRPEAAPQDQSGSDQLPAPEPPPVRRGSSPWPLYAGLGVLLFAVAGGLGYTIVGTSSPAATTTAVVTKAEPCGRQYADWKTGPAKSLMDTMIADLRRVNAAANTDDIARTAADLRRAGRDAAALRVDAMPACADPAGYWPRILTDITAAGGNADAAHGLSGMIRALEPLRPVKPLQARLHAELKRTT